MANYDGFLVGSQVIQPLVNNNNLPLDAKSIAQNKAEVLAKLDQGGRYIGLYIYCIDEAKIYVFKDGIEDSDFVPLTDGGAGGSVGTIGDNPTSIHYEICAETDDGALKVVGMVQDPLTEILITEVEDIANIDDFVKLVKSNSTDVYKYVDDKLDDTKSSNATTYSSEKIEQIINKNINKAEHMKYKYVQAGEISINNGANIQNIDKKTVYLELQGAFGTTDVHPYMFVDGVWRRLDTVAPQDIHYTTEYNGSVDNVSGALDAIMKKLFYVKPEIIGFTSAPNNIAMEVGDTIPQTRFSWSYNKNIVNQTLTDCTLADANVRSFTYTTPITETKTFTLVATDKEGETTSKNLTFSFVYLTYYGVSKKLPDTQDVVTGLVNSKLNTKLSQTSYLCTANDEYIVYAYPKSYGVLKSIKDPNKFECMSDFNRAELTITTAKNSADYYIYTSKSKKTLTDFEFIFIW